MRLLIIALIITNILIVAQMQIDRHIKEQKKLNKQICIEELIPIEELEVEK